MKLEDLRDGMVVEFRNGERYLVVNHQFTNFNYDIPYSQDMYYYEQDMCRYEQDEHLVDFDVVKVYRADSLILKKSLFQDKNLTLIWTRYKPPINKNERTILENINLDNKYKYIARDSNDFLHLYQNKPFKGCEWWISSPNDEVLKFPFHHLFNMVKWDDEEPTLIFDLLKGDK